MQRIQQIPELGPNRAVFQGAQIAAQLNGDIVTAEKRGAATEGFPHQALGPVPIDRPRRRPAAGDEAEARYCELVRERSRDEITSGNAYSGAQYRFEPVGLAEHARPADGRAADQTASRARPLALRALMIARPALVFMRARKP